VELFGERAFRPMSLTGEGTLTFNQALTLSTNPLQFLHNDAVGNNVVCYDSARMSDTYKETWLRVALYLWWVVSENETTQEQGCKVLVVGRDASDSFNDPVVKKSLVLLHKALPIRFQAVYMVNCPGESSTDELAFTDSCVPLMRNVIGPSLANLARVIFAATGEELVERLGEHGFTAQGLPVCIGGLWAAEQFERWQELRFRYEWELPAVKTKGSHDQMLPNLPIYKSKKTAEQTPQEASERKRRMNVLNSRRHRMRVRVEKAMYRDEANNLRFRNRSLVLENVILERLLDLAEAEVAKVEAE
jgi:hypothetical protein